MRVRSLVAPWLGVLAGGSFAACSAAEPPPDAPRDAAPPALLDATAPRDATFPPAKDAGIEAAAAPDAHDQGDAEDAPDVPPLPAIPEDFHVPGTQIGDVDAATYLRPDVCASCHGGGGMPDAPHSTWAGSLMANAGRDPLFFAQLATASQDVPKVGTYCLRCHVPMAIATGHAAYGTESALDDFDRDGVMCHFCHSMIDPLAGADAAVPGDTQVLASLADPPKHYGNSAFVLDPNGLRRGPYSDAHPPHPATVSAFVEKSEMCGTCHDVGNVRVTRLADGTYQYVAAGQRAPNADPEAQFPLERTYTEWKLSAFADGGVDAGGLFGGDAGGPVVSTCQDCHMPAVRGQGCVFAGVRDDLARHEFAGASSWVLGIIAKQYGAAVDGTALAAGQANAITMLQRAATVTLSASGGALRAHVVNRAGHKIPTGHIEGRRMWVGAVLTDAANQTLAEYGRWDPATGDLDEASTTVFEMQVGLSPQAAQATGLDAGVTTHMALADLVVKDNRIPPRGFVNAAYDAVGAGAVGATYADGQSWADVDFPIPTGAKHAVVTLWYQTVTREYVEALKSGNHTDAWGATLEDLWTSTGKDAPIAAAQATIDLP